MGWNADSMVNGIGGDRQQATENRICLSGAGIPICGNGEGFGGELPGSPQGL